MKKIRIISGLLGAIFIISLLLPGCLVKMKMESYASSGYETSNGGSTADTSISGSSDGQTTESVSSTHQLTRTQISTKSTTMGKSTTLATMSSNDVLTPAITSKTTFGGVNYMEYLTVRSPLSNSVYKLLHDRKLTVAYIGGSVTDGTGASSGDNSWRTKSVSWLRNAYPYANITAVRASVGGTGSGFGMYRIDNDVLGKNPDLVFIEFAVNDYFEGYTTKQIKTQIETMYRKIYAKNPYAEIVMVYVSDRGDDSSKTIPAHEVIAEYYQTNAIRLDQAISAVITDTGNPFDYYFADGVHPNDKGYSVYSNVVISYLQSALKGKSSALKAKSVPSLPLADLKMEASLYKAVDTTLLQASGWTKNTTKFSWLGPVYGGCITATENGSQFTLEFTGTDFGLLWEKAKDVGKIQYSVDGGATSTRSGYLDYSNPVQIMLANDLPNGEHTITICFEPTATGTRCAIAAFLVAGVLHQ